MSLRLTFAGPIEVRYDATRPLPLTLSAALAGTRGERVRVSMLVRPDPGLPSDLCDASLVVESDGQSVARPSASVACTLSAGNRQWTLSAERLFVHRDLSAPIREVVPPRPVSFGYRLRWQLGILLARTPGLRSLFQ